MVHNIVNKGCLSAEFEDIMFPMKVGSQLPNDTASHLRIITSTTPLYKLYIYILNSHNMPYLVQVQKDKTLLLSQPGSTFIMSDSFPYLW